MRAVRILPESVPEKRYLFWKGKKTMKKRFVLILAVCLCLALTACAGNDETPESSESNSAQQEQSARYKDFTGTLLNGGELTLSDYEGKVILLNFWATWCGPCVREMPAFPRLLEKYGDDLAVITVNLQEDEQTVADFIAENNYEFPVVLDTDGAVGKLYPTDSIPYTIIIAPDGTISDTSIGADTAERMVEEYSAMIDAALG